MAETDVQRYFDSTLVDRLHKNSDLFGEESDSDSEHPPSTGAHNGAKRPSPPAQKAKILKKKKREPQEKKPKKLKKSEVQQIHSDSQRLVRESTLNLPKYQPKMKDLSSFLTRVRSRKPHSAPVVTAIKSTPVAVTNIHHVDKENCTNEGSSPVTTPTTEDNTPQEIHTDHETISNEACVQRTSKSPSPPISLLEDKGDGSDSKDFSVLPDTKEGLVEDADLSFSVSPTTPTSHPASSVVISSGAIETTKTKTPTYTKQSTLTSLFAPKRLPVTPAPLPEIKLHPSPPPSPKAKPQLSSMDDFLLERDEALTVELEPERELTPLEKFQQRFTQHAASSQPNLEVKATKDSSNGEEKVPLIPKELVSKLVDKPGAIRQHLRSKLREQLSKLRAEERREAEEVRKMYSEDVEDEEEMEAELTDGETTDEEYEQDNEQAAVESDACSDLDNEEQLEDHNEDCNDSLGSSDRNSDKEGDSDSEDSISGPSLVKKKSTGLRILDSDEEDDDNPTPHFSTSSPSKEVVRPSTRDANHLDLDSNSTNSNSRTQHSIPVLNHDYSMSMFGSETTNSDNLTARISKKYSVQRRPSFLLNSMEPSMPPLILSPDSEGPDSPFGSPSEKYPESQTRNFDLTHSSSTIDLPKDSSVGTMIDDDNSQMTLGLDESANGSVNGSVAGGVSEKDSSLEMSFRWLDGPSLPPAQPRRENSATGKDLKATFDPHSQWEEAQALPPVPMAANTQSLQDSVGDEATQFLDADGFLCLGKEKRQVQSSSAVQDSLDFTQPDSPSTLLSTGKFNDTQDPPILSRHRHLSDSSSTQGVRELLGLSTKPKAVGISGLLSTEEGGSHADGGARFSSGQDFSQFNEVIGLCSGVFPTTQAPGQVTRPSQSMGSVCGTSDAQSSDESGDESQELRIDSKDKNGWAKKQGGFSSRQGGGYYSDSESEDEDMPLIKKKKMKVKINKSDRLAQFVESEAELSGSDVGPEEDDEILAEEEEGMYGYEEDEGNESDVPLSESELWDQVNKAHMKHTLADDKADLRDFKERFLKDGDLFEDGLALKNGFFRTRRFAKQGSEAGSLDLFSEGVGEGEVDGVGVAREELSSQAEALRRKERLEREEFMMKCREKDHSLLAMDEDSQSILNIIVDNSSQSLTTTPLPRRTKQVPKLTTPSLSSGGCKHTRGSFLKHDSNTLRRLSSLTTVTPKTGGVGSGFVFQKKPGSTAEEEADSRSKKPKKRLISSDKNSEAKRPKLDRSQSAPQGDFKNSSIFSMLR